MPATVAPAPSVVEFSTLDIAPSPTDTQLVACVAAFLPIVTHVASNEFALVFNPYHTPLVRFVGYVGVADESSTTAVVEKKDATYQPSIPWLPVLSIHVMSLRTPLLIVATTINVLEFIVSALVDSLINVKVKLSDSDDTAGNTIVCVAVPVNT